MTFRVCASALAGLCLLGPAMAQDEENKPDQAATAVRQTGALVLRLAQDDDRLDVAYHLGKADLTAEIMGTLATIKDRLYSLNLRGTNMNDALAQYLAPLTELVRLHLEKTAITDAALAHLAGMQKLEYLNLYGTKITDAGLKHLHGLKSLKKVFVWQTDVTLEGVHALQAALPELQVIGGPPEPIVAVVAPLPKPQAINPPQAKKEPKAEKKSEAKDDAKKENAEETPAKPDSKKKEAKEKAKPDQGKPSQADKKEKDK